MDRETAIAKIKKCLTLGRSAEPHEAAAAMRQAQKLMAAFGLAERDISLADVREVKVRAASTAANAWDVSLRNICADAFGCESFSELTAHINAAGNYVRARLCVFVGLDAAADVAAYTYEVLARQCARSRLAHIAKQPRGCKPVTKTARGDAFAIGWVAGVRGLIERFAQPARDEQLLLDYIGSHYPSLATKETRNTTKNRKLADGHFIHGRLAGQQAELNRGVGARKQELLT